MLTVPGPIREICKMLLLVLKILQEISKYTVAVEETIAVTLD